MIGDTTADVRAAKRAGAYAVAVLSGFGVRGELEKAGADLVLPRAELLLEHLNLASAPRQDPLPAIGDAD